MAEAPAEAAITVSRLSRRFGRRWVLRHVDGRFDGGTATAVIGHNGAGKSTLLSILSGTLRPTEGTVTVLGERLDGYPTMRLRRALGVLGHQPFVYPELSGRENLAFFARLYGTGARSPRIASLLETVGLAFAAERAARTYSRGMVQRLALARVLLQDAPIWLLDEPTTGLDTEGRSLVIGALQEAKRAGRTLIIITHNPGLLAGVVDTVLTLDGGRVAGWHSQARDEAASRGPGASSEVVA